MGIRSAFERFLGRTPRRRTAPAPPLPAAYEMDEELAWLFPPSGDAGAEAWQRYWSDQLAHHLAPPLFDMLFDDHDLAEEMARAGLRTVLCAGNGISMEPRALAAAGFTVTAVDLSPLALEVARTDPCVGVPIEHFIDPRSARPGGGVTFVEGDILDPACCPGPFDVVIERRMAQDYPAERLGEVLGALAARLAPEGILVTHCHDAAWKPPAPPRHVTLDWLRAHGWRIWNGAGGPKPPGRVAWPVVSTG